MLGARLTDLGETSINEWIDNAHAGVHEISTVSGGDRQAVDSRRRRDEAVLNRQGCPRVRAKLLV